MDLLLELLLELVTMDILLVLLLLLLELNPIPFMCYKHRYVPNCE